MKLIELVNQLNLTVFSGEELLEKEFDGAYVSDLLSDVMGNAKEGQLWITLQTHKNVVAVASLKDLAAVILVKGLKPEEDALNQSKEEGLVLLGTKMDTFSLSGKIYQRLYA